ncbi:hypothetical protein KR200_001654, partial [Drosophila serrata]
PSLFFVLFWRVAMDVLYPFSYMDRFLEDALANESLVWTPSTRIPRLLLTATRSAFRTILMMVMLMELFQGLDEALAMQAAANR